MTCAYCGGRAIHRDHVVPKSLAKRRPDLPNILTQTVPSCGQCNWWKMTRKLVPPSWEDKIPLLKELLPGPWRVWAGDPRDPNFTEAHL